MVHGDWKLRLVYVVPIPSPLAPPGAVVSASFEPPCTAVVGASGGVFGLVGLFLADLLLNFETTTRCGHTRATHHVPFDRLAVWLLTRVPPNTAPSCAACAC